MYIRLRCIFCLQVKNASHQVYFELFNGPKLFLAPAVTEGATGEALESGAQQHMLTIFGIWVTPRCPMDRLKYFLCELYSQGDRRD